jgi:hypothetical protein
VEVSSRRIPLLAHEPHHVRGDTRELGCLARIIEERGLGDQGPCAGILELARKLLDGIGRVRGGSDATSPLNAEVNDRVVYGVRGEEAENVALSP